jgi:hypothetical protein
LNGLNGSERIDAERGQASSFLSNSIRAGYAHPRSGLIRSIRAIRLIRYWVVDRPSDREIGCDDVGFFRRDSD